MHFCFCCVSRHREHFSYCLCAFPLVCVFCSLPTINFCIPVTFNLFLTMLFGAVLSPPYFLFLCTSSSPLPPYMYQQHWRECYKIKTKACRNTGNSCSSWCLFCICLYVLLLMYFLLSFCVLFLSVCLFLGVWCKSPCTTFFFNLYTSAKISQSLPSLLCL